MSYKTVQYTFGADVAAGATFVVPYPAGTTPGDFSNAVGHYMVINGSRLSQPEGILLTFGAVATGITVTNNTTAPILAKTVGFLGLNRSGSQISIKGTAGGNGTIMNTVSPRMNDVEVVQVNLGSPVAGAANNIATSQAVTIGTTPLAVLNGTLVAAGVAVLDVPRNIVAAWTGTAVVTITGTDEYGRTVVESSASGTSLAGLKAFKTVTSVSFSANVTAATIGTGNVLGLPVHIPKATVGYVLKELQDDAVATAGTLVAGLSKNTVSTATTADIRGTYTPNSTPNGALAFSLVVVVADKQFQGVGQFAG